MTLAQPFTYCPRELLMRRTAAALLVILALGVLVAPVITTAQPREKIPRVGMLIPGPSPGTSQNCPSGFQQGLRDLGYVEGQTILFESRFAEDQLDRLPALATELVRLTPDVIWTFSTPGIQAARQATTTIPIVSVFSPLGDQGLAESLARPGGNITGLDLRLLEVLGKRLELLKAAVPTIVRVAVMVNPANPAQQEIPHNIESEARALGVQLQRVEASGPEAFEAAFATMVQGKADALMIAEGQPFGGSNLQRILEFARQHWLPTASGGRSYAAAGVLLAYGADAYDLCRRSAVFVDKILKGAKPAALPVECAHKFEFIVNLTTAKALGLTLPPTLLFQADEVLQ